MVTHLEVDQQFGILSCHVPNLHDFWPWTDLHAIATHLALLN